VKTDEEKAYFNLRQQWIWLHTFTFSFRWNLA